MRHQSVLRHSRATLVLLSLGLLASMAAAQEGRPAPDSPSPPSPNVPAAIDQPNGAIPNDGSEPARYNNGRRPPRDDMVVLAFEDVSIEDTIPFIVETTGKVVMPVNITTLRAKKVTLVNDEPIDRMVALDLLFSAFRLNDVGVIETDDRIIIALTAEMHAFETPVIGPDEDILHRTDLGTRVTKIFRVLNTDAESLAEQLRDPLPDYATLTVDPNSNSIIVTGDIGLCQRIAELIAVLDHTYVEPKTQTFRLKYADAAEIAQNILELFEDIGTQVRTGRSSPSQPQTRRPMTPDQRRRFRDAQQRGVSGQQAGVGPTVELRVTVNVQQNAVTVSGEPSVVDQIAELIDTQWDLPRPEGTAKVYHLKYTDPIKMRDMLQELLGQQATGGVRSPRRGVGGAGAAGRANVQEGIGGIYQIQAYPDSNTLVVICKTEESFKFLDSLIEDLDQPLQAGLPIVVELKHANAVDLSEQLNALLAPPGAGATIQRPGTGLGGGEGVGESPFASGGEGATTGTGREGDAAGTISFPWQRGRSREDEAPPSPLIGKVRIVPIVRQNALAIVAVPELQQAVLDFIAQVDKPGRQVMIAAIIAEVERTDELALGLRISNSGTILSGGLADNRIGSTVTAEASEEGIFGSLFDTSLLNVGVSVNVVLQALDQKTNVRILQEPRIFTADNQEASFFDGQDIPFIQTSTTTDFGTVNETFDYRAVGIMLNVRPRITVERDVDLEVNLELSSIVPGQTLFGGFIVDRRETTTQIIVKNGQTIVLSGILRDQESQITHRLPLLGYIPLIGELFTSRENSITKTELIAFITPVVVDNPSENDANFNAGERGRLEELTRPLKEQIRELSDRDRLRSRLLYKQHENAQQSEPAQQPPSDIDELNEE